MRLLIVVLLCFCSLKVSAVHGGSITDPKTLESIRMFIIANGYACQDLDHASFLAFKEGFSVWCRKNGELRYHYEIYDQGGRWMINVR
jgi:hypothetical protein